MPRRSQRDVLARVEGESKLRAVIGDKPPRKRKHGASLRAWADALEAADGMLASGEYEGIRPLQLLALYARLHERVYEGMPDSELKMNPRARAAGAAAMTRLVAELGGEVEVVAFFRWAWHREVGREAWRKQNNGGNGGRLTWQALSSGRVLTDYRVDRNRKAG